MRKKKIKKEIKTIKKLIGKCKQCGGCCRNITLDFGIPIKYKYDFLRNDFDNFIEQFIGAQIKSPFRFYYG